MANSKVQIPNSTHVMQPLDVGFLSLLKIVGRKKLISPKLIITANLFTQVLERAFNGMSGLERIFQNSFRSYGLFPFDSSNVHYNKLILTNENEEAKAVTQTENSDIVNHLRCLETYIEPNLLSEFYNRQGDLWNHNDESTSLYRTWLKIFKHPGLYFKEKENASVIIEIEDGLILEEGWENAIITEDFENEDCIIVNETNNSLTNEFNKKETQPIEKLLEENNEGTEQCELINSEVL